MSGMFEGVIDYDSVGYPFRGDISLAIPVDSDDYIDTEKYHMLSFAITVDNPNRLDDNACAMLIKWIDSADSSPGWVSFLSEPGYHIGNGWDRWSVIGPIDLDSTSSLGWGNGTAKELWIRFQGSGTIIDPPAPVDIRIGWIRLEESAP